MSLLKSILLVFIISGSAYGARINSPSSYIIACDDPSNPVHLMPLTFYEFKDDVDISKLPENLTQPFLKAAPRTFSSLDRKIKGFHKSKDEMPYVDAYRYDTILNPPANCSVQLLASPYLGEPSELRLHKELWDKVDKRIQNFALLEVALQQILATDLAPVDYRRFALYIATGSFDQYSQEQKIFFLQHHKINELSLQGVSLDLKREIIYFEDGSGSISDAFAIKNSTFEGGVVDEKRFVSFYRTGELKAIATLTPFKRKMKGQEFAFFTPPDEISADNYEHPYDDRYNPRTEFYKNGLVERSFTEVYPNFFNLVTNIEARLFNPAFKRKSFEVEFWENGTPRETRNNPGDLVIGNKTYKVLSAYWNENGILHEASFANMEKIQIKGVLQDAHGVTCDENGQIEYVF